MCTDHTPSPVPQEPVTPDLAQVAWHAARLAMAATEALHRVQEFEGTFWVELAPEPYSAQGQDQILVVFSQAVLRDRARRILEAADWGFTVVPWEDPYDCGLYLSEQVWCGSPRA